jgi:acyl carrier protein
MASSSNGPLSFEQFRALLAEILLIEEEKLRPDASFACDLYVDSLRWAEMALSLEEIDAHIPTEAFWEIQTVEDAYRIYLAYAQPAP